MRSDEQMEAMETLETGEDWAIVRALRKGAAPAPEFRARLKQSFLSEAELDARRRKAYKLSILGLPKFYVNLAAAGAAAALILIALTYNIWFRPTPALEIAGEPHQSERGMLLDSKSGALGFAPHAGDRADAVYVEYSRPFTDEVPGIVELIAVEAGGAVELTGDAQAVVLTVSSDVVDHVLDRLSEAIGTAVISKPVHLNSEQVTIYITFSPD